MPPSPLASLAPLPQAGEESARYARVRRSRPKEPELRRVLALVARPLRFHHVPAALLHAADLRPLAALLLHEEGGGALGAGLGDRAVPGNEVALRLRVVRAAEEH